MRIKQLNDLLSSGAPTGDLRQNACNNALANAPGMYKGLRQMKTQHFIGKTCQKIRISANIRCRGRQVLINFA